ncbi:hypothetical protein CAEBREN_13194 [Caenorhabditis brenneri]|uniref:Uncharacterized protein n=1 Tax=Caenorhabditis brenneri TaxID=135651 RepID=G0NQV0_CAEBE|nr:hypothetical protein CAEBREN_13194 [Caenorhabditis brenneri]
MSFKSSGIVTSRNSSNTTTISCRIEPDTVNEAQKLQKQLGADYSDAEDDNGGNGKKKTKSVISEIVMLIEEEDEDIEVMMKRLNCLEIKKHSEYVSPPIVL